MHYKLDLEFFLEIDLNLKSKKKMSKVMQILS